MIGVPAMILLPRGRCRTERLCINKYHYRNGDLHILYHVILCRYMNTHECHSDVAESANTLVPVCFVGATHS